MDNVIPMHKSPRSGPKSVLLSLLVTVIVAAIYYYVQLPALNIKSPDLYFFLVFLLVVYMVALAIFSGGRLRDDPKGFALFLKGHCKVPLVILALIIVAVAIGALSSALIFRAGDYS